MFILFFAFLLVAILPLNKLIYFLVALFLLHPNFVPIVFEVSHISVRITDLLILAIVFRWFIEGSVKGTLKISKNPIASPLILFLVSILISTLLAGVRGYDYFSTSLVAFLKYALYAFTLFLVIMALKTKQHIKNALIVFIFIAIFQISYATFLYWRDFPVYDRNDLGVLISINTLGLISGMLILIGLVFLIYREKIVSRKLLFVLPLLGGWGLFLSGSIMSLLAVGLSILILFFLKRQEFRISLSKLGLIVLIVVVGGSYTLFVLRGPDIVGLMIGEGGSPIQRLMLSYMGALIFLENPVFGVGWHGSSDAMHISRPEFVSQAMELFPAFPLHYFTIDFQTSLHNTYVQIFSDTGIVGAICFFIVVFVIIKYGWRTHKKLEFKFERASSLAIFLCILNILFWLNANPIFGGNPEQGIFWFLVGMLVVLNKISNKNERKQIN
jgi:O-antigen ligase